MGTAEAYTIPYRSPYVLAFISSKYFDCTIRKATQQQQRAVTAPKTLLTVYLPALLRSCRSDFDWSAYTACMHFASFFFHAADNFRRILREANGKEGKRERDRGGDGSIRWY